MANKVQSQGEDSLYSKIAAILEQNRKSVAVAVNTAMVRNFYLTYQISSTTIPDAY